MPKPVMFIALCGCFPVVEFKQGVLAGERVFDDSCSVKVKTAGSLSNTIYEALGGPSYRFVVMPVLIQPDRWMQFAVQFLNMKGGYT